MHQVYGANMEEVNSHSHSLYLNLNRRAAHQTNKHHQPNIQTNKINIWSNKTQNYKDLKGANFLQIATEFLKSSWKHSMQIYGRGRTAKFLVKVSKNWTQDTMDISIKTIPYGTPPLESKLRRWCMIEFLVSYIVCMHQKSCFCDSCCEEGYMLKWIFAMFQIWIQISEIRKGRNGI